MSYDVWYWHLRQAKVASLELDPSLCFLPEKLGIFFHGSPLNPRGQRWSPEEARAMCPSEVMFCDVILYHMISCNVIYIQIRISPVLHLPVDKNATDWNLSDRMDQVRASRAFGANKAERLDTVSMKGDDGTWYCKVLFYINATLSCTWLTVTLYTGSLTLLG